MKRLGEKYEKDRLRLTLKENYLIESHNNDYFSPIKFKFLLEFLISNKIYKIKKKEIY